MKKSSKTYDRIIDVSLNKAIMVGLEGLSFGMIADLVGMSKSGLFAHFESKEHLQQAVLDEAIQRFQNFVISPAWQHPSGVKRLEVYFNNYLDWTEGQLEVAGCPFITFKSEFDDRPGPIRDKLVTSTINLQKTLGIEIKEAQKNSEIPTKASPKQIAFEIYAIILSFKDSLKLLKDTEARMLANTAFKRAIS